MAFSFELTYQVDRGLEFLRQAEHQDLLPLAELLTTHHDKRRISDQLSKHPDFLSHRDDLTQCWQLLAAELQRYGGDSVASFARGHGVTYREILADVGGRYGVKFPVKAGYELIEQRIVKKVAKEALSRMSEEELRALVQELQDQGGWKGDALLRATPSAILAGFQASVKLAGFTAYTLNVVIANAALKMVVNRGLSLAANAVASRALAAFTGPVGWAVTAAATVPAITGPAFRVTIPSVLYLAMLRQKLKKQRSC